MNWRQWLVQAPLAPHTDTYATAAAAAAAATAALRSSTPSLPGHPPLPPPDDDAYSYQLKPRLLNWRQGLVQGPLPHTAARTPRPPLLPLLPLPPCAPRLLLYPIIRRCRRPTTTHRGATLERLSFFEPSSEREKVERHHTHTLHAAPCPPPPPPPRPSAEPRSR